MKIATLLLPLLVLVCTAHALPLDPDVTSSVSDEHWSVPVEPEIEEKAVIESENNLVRERRSPGGWQQQPQPRPAPQPQPQSRGSITGGVHRERGVGTVVHAQGQGTVWRSRDGNAQVDAHGQYHRVVRGPARGRPNYNVGVTYSRRF